jgi:hypothetical protein
MVHCYEFFFFVFLFLFFFIHHILIIHIHHIVFSTPFVLRLIPGIFYREWLVGCWLVWRHVFFRALNDGFLSVFCQEFFFFINDVFVMGRGFSMI